MHSGCGNSENSELPTSGSTPTICRSSPSPTSFASLVAHHLSQSLQHPACCGRVSLPRTRTRTRARAHTPTVATPRPSPLFCSPPLHSFSLVPVDGLPSSFHPRIRFLRVSSERSLFLGQCSGFLRISRARPRGHEGVGCRTFKIERVATRFARRDTRARVSRHQLCRRLYTEYRERPYLLPRPAHAGRRDRG